MNKRMAATALLALFAGTAQATVIKFSNMGAPHELHFELIRRTDGWKIDDIESIGENGWRLSELLAADPLLN